MFGNEHSHDVISPTVGIETQYAKIFLILVRCYGSEELWDNLGFRYGQMCTYALLSITHRKEKQHWVG